VLNFLRLGQTSISNPFGSDESSLLLVLGDDIVLFDRLKELTEKPPSLAQSEFELAGLLLSGVFERVGIRLDS